MRDALIRGGAFILPEGGISAESVAKEGVSVALPRLVEIAAEDGS